MEKLLGDRLRELRTKMDLTQTAVAESLGMTRGTYAHYEINKRQPDFETLKKLANFFNVSTDYLLGRSLSQTSDSMEDIPKEVRALARDINDLNSGDKDLLKAMVETMRKRGREAMDK